MGTHEPRLRLWFLQAFNEYVTLLSQISEWNQSILSCFEINLFENPIVLSNGHHETQPRYYKHQIQSRVGCCMICMGFPGWVTFRSDLSIVMQTFTRGYRSHKISQDPMKPPFSYGFSCGFPVYHVGKISSSRCFLCPDRKPTPTWLRPSWSRRIRRPIGLVPG